MGYRGGAVLTLPICKALLTIGAMPLKPMIRPRGRGSVFRMAASLWQVAKMPARKPCRRMFRRWLRRWPRLRRPEVGALPLRNFGIAASHHSTGTVPGGIDYPDRKG